jgi:hypothetical protein
LEKAMSKNKNGNSVPAQFNSFSGELDLDDLQFLSDQQSEMLVGGIAVNGILTNLPINCAPRKKECSPIPCATMLPHQVKRKR